MPPNPTLLSFWSSLTSAQKDVFVKWGKTSKVTISSAVHGIRNVSAMKAHVLDEASRKLSAKYPEAPRMRREDWCSACRRCPYAVHAAEQRRLEPDNNSSK